MAHYAKVLDNIVIKVIRAESSFFDTFIDDSPGTWLKTSYNTYGNVHNLAGIPLRKNFAGVGYSYDIILDAFIAPQPYPSWILNTTSGLWEAPITYPITGNYYWDEPTLSWIELI